MPTCEEYKINVHLFYDDLKDKNKEAESCFHKTYYGEFTDGKLIPSKFHRSLIQTTIQNYGTRINEVEEFVKDTLHETITIFFKDKVNESTFNFDGVTSFQPFLQQTYLNQVHGYFKKSGFIPLDKTQKKARISNLIKKRLTNLDIKFNEDKLENFVDDWVNSKKGSIKQTAITTFKNTLHESDRLLIDWEAVMAQIEEAMKTIYVNFVDIDSFYGENRQDGDDKDSDDKDSDDNIKGKNLRIDPILLVEDENLNGKRETFDHSQRIRSCITGALAILKIGDSKCYELLTRTTDLNQLVNAKAIIQTSNERASKFAVSFVNGLDEGIDEEALQARFLDYGGDTILKGTATRYASVLYQAIQYRQKIKISDTEKEKTKATEDIKTHIESLWRKGEKNNSVVWKQIEPIVNAVLDISNLHFVKDVVISLVFSGHAILNDERKVIVQEKADQFASNVVAFLQNRTKTKAAFIQSFSSNGFFSLANNTQQEHGTMLYQAYLYYTKMITYEDVCEQVALQFAPEGYEKAKSPSKQRYDSLVDTLKLFQNNTEETFIRQVVSNLIAYNYSETIKYKLAPNDKKSCYYGFRELVNQELIKRGIEPRKSGK